MTNITNQSVYDYVCKSTETKETDVPDGSTLYEVDTKKLYMFYDGIWREM